MVSKMKCGKISILLIFAVLIFVCGCSGTSENVTEAAESDEFKYDTNWIPQEDGTYIYTKDKLNRHISIYKFYDEEDDVYIYTKSAPKSGICVIPRNEVEYWKNYDVSEFDD